MTSKSHISQDHHGDMRSRLQKSERRQTPARVGSFLFLSFYFFSVSFSCLTSVFVCKCNTDILITACRRRLQICFRGGSAAGEQQAPGRSSISTMADAEEKEEKEKKNGSAGFERDREIEREREREREREKRNKQKPGALVNLMWRFLFFSHQSTSRNPRSRKKANLRLRYSFPIRPATSGYHSL